MVKKIISVILSIMILSSMFTGVVFAANEFNFEFTADATQSVKHYSAFWHRHDGSASNDDNSYITYMNDRSSYALYDFTDIIPYIYAAKSITAFAAYSYRISGMHMIALDDSCEQYINASLTSAIASEKGMTTGHTVVYDTDTTQVTTKTFDADKDALIAALETGDNGIVAVRFAGVPNAANTQSAGVTLTFTYDEETYLQDAADYLDWSDVSDIPADEIKVDTISLPSKLAGCDVTWSSNSPAINALTGAVTRAESDQEVTLTATFSHEGNTATKHFNVVVPQTTAATTSVKHYSAFWHRHDGSASNDANSYITYMDDRSSYALYDFTDIIPYIYAAKSITAFAAYNYRISGMHMIALDDSCEQYVNASLTSAIASQKGMTTGHTVVYDTDTTQVTTKTFDADKDALIAALETGDNDIIAVRFAAVPNAANTQSAGVTLTFAYDKETYLDDIADYLDWSNVSDIPANKIKADTISLPSKLAGCDVTWSSNSPAINALTGAVTRAESDQAVTLTATLSHGGNTTSKEFNVVVKEEPKTITIPYTNYGAARSGGIFANGIQLNRFIVSGGTWYGVAQLDLTGYEKILKSPDTSVKLTLVSELNQVNGNLSDFTVYLAPDTVDSYKADETVYETLEALGAFNTGRPVLAVDNDNQTISTAGTPVTVDANKQNLISVLNEGGSKNSIVTVYFAPTVQSAMLMNSANAGLTISYYESEVDNTIEPPVITIDGNSVSAKFVSCNFTDVDEGYTALLAVYSDEGELLELADPQQIKGAGRHEITLSASYSSGCIAKAFVWNNMTNATPLLVSTVEDGTGDGTEEAPEDSIDMSGLNVLVDESKITEIKNSTDPLVTQWRAETISDANAALTQGVYDYSKFSTGEMKNIEESMDRVMNLGMAYLLTADVKYSNRAYAEINEFLKMEDWNKESFLDIAEISTIVSIAYNWMYTAWTKPQRDAMAAKLLEAIDYTNKLYKEELPDPNGWIGCSNNWNAVCNGGMAIAAITVMDKNPSLCTQVKDRALSELEYVLDEFAPYGGWEEGPGYWAYTLQYLTALASTLNNTYGTDLGIGNTVGLEESLMLSVSLEGKTGIMNIGDASEAHVYAPEMFYWADYYENPAVNGAAMWTLNTFNFEPNVFTLIYYNPAYGTSFEKASALYFRGTETVTLESGSAIDDSFIGISGGEGDTSHGHLDSGSVIVDMKGERFIRDIGSEHYGKDGYFSTNRYYYYRARPEGHNIFVINPSSEVNGTKTYHGQSSSAYSAITSFDATKKEAVLDLTDAYSRDASSASRKISLNGANIVIEDNITLKSSKEVHWYFHTDATVSISGNTATLTKNGKTITMTFNAGQNSGSLSLVPAARFNSTTKVTDSDNSHIQKLDFKMTNASGAVNVKITIAG